MGMCGRHCPLITCWKQIDMPLLDEDAFRATFGSRMVRVQSDGNAPFPIWSYVDQIPSKDFQGYDCSEGSVQWVWRSEDGRFEHVLIDAKEDKDVFMVVVLDLTKREVFGHRLMDFKRVWFARVTRCHVDDRHALLKAPDQISATGTFRRALASTPNDCFVES